MARRQARVRRAPRLTHASLGVTDWNLDPTVALGLVGLVAAYLVARRRGLLRADDDVSSWFGSERWRPVCFGAGIVSALLALQSPIDVGGDEYLLSIHMAQHLILMMVAPPLVLLGIVGARPPQPHVAPRLRGLWTRITRPWAATVLFSAVLLVWHLPALYDTTLTNQGLHIVEHLTFVAAGIVFWWPIVDPVQGEGTVAVGPFTKIAMLVLAGVPPTILGFVFAMAHRAFYSFYEAAPRLWGLTPVADQAAAGVIMLGAGNLIYFGAISLIFLRMFASADDDDAERDMELTTPAHGR